MSLLFLVLVWAVAFGPDTLAHVRWLWHRHKATW